MAGPLLITSFEPYGGRSSNMSTRLLAPLGAEPIPGVETRILPVEPAALQRIVPELARSLRPQRWLLLGEDPSGDHLSCERVAVNLVEAATDAGAPPSSGRAVRGGPDAYFTTLDPVRMRRWLRSRDIPAELSESAGTVACNLALYLALHHARRVDPDIEVGLLLVPRHYRRTGHSLKELREVVLGLVADLAVEVAPPDRPVGEAGL